VFTSEDAVGLGTDLATLRVAFKKAVWCVHKK